MAVSCECCVVPGRDLCDYDNSADDVDMFRMSEGGQKGYHYRCKLRPSVTVE